MNGVLRHALLLGAGRVTGERAPLIKGSGQGVAGEMNYCPGAELGQAR